MLRGFPWDLARYSQGKATEALGQTRLTMRATLLLTALIVVGCQTQYEPYKFSGGDGSTRENAVVIKARDVGIGVAAQMVWMKERYLGWHEITNDYERVGSRFFNSVVVARDGQTNRIYFDYTEFAPKD